jgi:hypothetical protein
MASTTTARIDLALHAKQSVAFETPATEVLYGGAVGGGKALAVDTPIATPSGWTPIGELAVGDQVFDEYGVPCRVLAVSPVMPGRPCYRLMFSADGPGIVADAEHQWPFNPLQSQTPFALRTTADIAATMQWETHLVAPAGPPLGAEPFQSEDAELLFEPPRHGVQVRRYIVACEPNPSEPVRCIQVDSPSSLYLAGREMVPTHNSFLMRAGAIAWAGQIPGLQVYLFRRLRDDLVKTHMEGPKGLHALLSPWVDGGFVNIVEDEIRFWNGSKIFLCHCKEEKDRYKYLGAEIHLLCLDELTTFTEVIYRFLRSRVRMVGIQVPAELQGRFPRILCSSNPGNIGHQWVKAAFIDPRTPLEIVRMPESEGGMLRQYIPARLSDNPSMMTDDPGYASKLEGLGSPELVRAWRDGDWSVVAGAYFPEFGPQHIVRPFRIPASWLCFRSMDWGSARPFAVQWFAVSDGIVPGIPVGALVLYREWYGASAPNVGLRLTAEQVADGIRERELGDDEIAYGVADPAMFAADGGPSLAERMARRGVRFKPADNKRVGRLGAAGGWDLVRQRLIGEDSMPALYVFNTARDLIRTLPALQHDEAQPEDLDSSGDDHCGDALRYACASRPWIRAERAAAKLAPSLDDLWDLRQQDRDRGRVG